MTSRRKFLAGVVGAATIPVVGIPATAKTIESELIAQGYAFWPVGACTRASADLKKTFFPVFRRSVESTPDGWMGVNDETVILPDGYADAPWEQEYWVHTKPEGKPNSVRVIWRHRHTREVLR